MDFSGMMQRVVRALSFDTKFYDEARDTPALTNEALYVVIGSTLLASLGALGGGFRGLIATLLAGIVGYYVWAWVTKIVGASFFNGTGDTGMLLRTLGYAYAPRALGLLGFLPCVGGIALFLSFIWTLATGVLAVREGHSVDTTKAIVICIIGWVILIVVQVVFSLMFGVLGAIF